MNNQNFNESDIKNIFKWKDLNEFRKNKPGKIIVLCKIKRLETKFVENKTSLILIIKLLMMQTFR